MIILKSWQRYCVERLCLMFTIFLFLAVPAGMWYTGEWAETIPAFIRIITSPGPLVTDYFALGNLPAAFLNAALCGGAFTVLMYIAEGEVPTSHWGGYFLVIAHCFYGLNFLNMWFPVLGLFLVSKLKGEYFMKQLHIAMLSTAFGPLFSELLFRYPLFSSVTVPFGVSSLSIGGLLIACAVALFLGYAVPASLNGATRLHRGYNLYNAGLAFGLIGFLLFAFLYKTMGVEGVGAQTFANAIYEVHGRSYQAFLNVFFCIVFGVCCLFGYHDDVVRHEVYKELLHDTGKRTNFVEKYGFETTVMNLGVTGFMMLAYFNLVILLTDGAGFTGATCGVLLASVCFTSNGQHPHNVWPILMGYVTLFLFVLGLSTLRGAAVPWTLSTQGYMNGVAFATGLCPFTGVFGRKYGWMAGIFCAVMCTSTAAIHGYFVLYNGGFTAGITALIMIALLDHHFTGEKRTRM